MNYEVLIDAAQNGDIETVQIQVNRGLDINITDGETTALIAAAEFGFETVVQILINEKAYVNVKRPTDGATALIRAAANGHCGVVQRLLATAADINAQDQSGKTALIYAVESGKEYPVCLILDSQPAINIQDGRGYTALFYAAGSGRDDIAMLLLRAKAEMDIKSNSGLTALIIAVKSNHKNVVKLLLDEGAETGTKDSIGFTALDWAVANNLVEIVGLLVSAGVMINTEGPGTGHSSAGNSALIEAASLGHLDILNQLLRAGADTTRENFNGDTALCKAAAKGRTEIVSLLLDERTKISCQGQDEDRALIKAANKGHYDVVILLLASRNSLAENDDTLRSVFMGAVSAGSQPIVELLLKKYPKMVSDYGPEALLGAVSAGQHNITEMLLNLGVDVETQNRHESTLLILTAQYGDRKMLQLLLGKGASLYAKDKDGKSALHWAVASKAWFFVFLFLKTETEECTACVEKRALSHSEVLGDLKKITDELCTHGTFGDELGHKSLLSAARGGHILAVQFLIQVGISVNAHNANGHTALMLASRNGQEEISRFLLEVGAAKSTVAVDGETALLYAIKGGFPKIVKLLLPKEFTTSDWGDWEMLLGTAVSNDQNVIVRLLLEMVTDEEMRQRGLGRLLIQAAGLGHLDRVRFLLEIGAPVDGHHVQYNQRPLFEAAELGHEGVVQLLLENGADVYQDGRLWNMSESITRLLENRPFVPPRLDFAVLKGPALYSSVPPKDSLLSPKAFSACKIKASAIHFYLLKDLKNRREYRIERRPSVLDLAYGEYESSLFSALQPPMDEKWAFRWFHLPANNMEWVDALMMKLYDEAKNRRRWWAGEEVQGSTPHSRFMKPSCKTEESGNIMLFMPYLHFETGRGQEQMALAVRRNDLVYTHDIYRNKIHIDQTMDHKVIDAYLHETLQNRKKPLHIRRTLDQYIYGALDETKLRDLDQIVFRSDGREHEADFLEKESYLLVVDQLWLWIVNKDTIITSFPEMWNSQEKVQANEFNILESVISYLHGENRAPVKSAYDLSLVIISTCIGMFNQHPGIGPDGLSFMDIIRKDVNEKTDKEFELYMEYRHVRSLDNLSNVTQEVEIWNEIKDVIDELDIILLIINDQSSICDTWKTGSPDEDYNIWSANLRDLLGHIAYAADVQRIKNVALKTRKSLRELMDLKQTQASVRLAENAARQGKAVLIFTIVTIAFLPASFMAAFFAINIAEFERDSNGALRLQYVSKYLFGIAVAVSVPIILFAFSSRINGHFRAIFPAYSRNSRAVHRHGKAFSREMKVEKKWKNGAEDVEIADRTAWRNP